MADLEVPISVDLSAALKQMDTLTKKAEDVGKRSGEAISNGVKAGAAGTAGGGGKPNAAAVAAGAGGGGAGGLIDKFAMPAALGVAAYKAGKFAVDAYEIDKRFLSPMQQERAVRDAMPGGNVLGTIKDLGAMATGNKTLGEKEYELERMRDLNAIRTNIRQNRLTAAGDTMGAAQAGIEERFKNSIYDAAAANDNQKMALLMQAKQQELTSLAASGGNASTLGAGSFGQMSMSNVEMLAAMQAVAKNTAQIQPPTLR